MFIRLILYIFSKMYLFLRLGNILCDNIIRYFLIYQVEKKIDCRFKDQILGREINFTLWFLELLFVGLYWIRYNIESFVIIVKKKKNSIKYNNDIVRILCIVYVLFKGMRYQSFYVVVVKRVGDFCVDFFLFILLIKQVWKI